MKYQFECVKNPLKIKEKVVYLICDIGFIWFPQMLGNFNDMTSF